MDIYITEEDNPDALAEGNFKKHLINPNGFL